MAANGKVLETVISIGGKLDPSVSAAINKAELQLKHFSAGLAGLEKRAAVAGAAIAAGMAAGVAAIGSKLFSLGQEFDEASKTIRVGTGATGEALKDLQKSFDAVYSSVPSDKTAVAKAISDINTLTGATGKNLENFSTAALQAARLTGESSESIISSTAAAFNAFGINNDAMAQKLDFLFKVSQSTGVAIADIGAAAQSNSSVFKTLGLDFEHAAVLMANLKKAGLEDTAVLAGMKKALQNMQKAGVKDFHRGMENAAAKIRAAKTDTEALSLATQAFGAKAAPVMAKAIRAGALDIEKNLAALNENNETLAAAYKDTESFSDAWARMTNSLSVKFKDPAQELTKSFRDILPKFEELATRALPYVTRAAQILTEKIKAFSAAVQRFDWSRVTKYISVFVDRFKQLGAFVQRNQKNFMTLGKVILTLLAAFHAVQGAVAIFTALSAAVALVTSPVFLTIAALTALVSAAWFLYDNWNDVCTWCAAAWQKFTAGLSDLWGKFSEEFPQTARIMTAAWEVGTAALSQAWTWCMDAVKAAIPPVVEFFKQSWEYIKMAAEIVGAYIVTVWKNALDGIRTAMEAVSTVIIGIFNAWPEVFAAVTAALNGDWDSFMSHFTRAAEIMKQTFINVWAEIEAFIQRVFERIVSFIQPIIDKIEGLGDFLNGAKGAAGSAWESAKKAVGYAAGGFTSGPSICGEAGTEAVISFDPRYRAQNQAYLATAAEMLNMTAAPTPVAGSVTNLGGITFAPVINGAGGEPQDIITQLRAAMPDLMDMIEDALKERNSHRYA